MTRRKATRFLWTTESLKILRDLAATGMRSYEIADAVGCTRMAVIGMANRRGIPLLFRRIHGVSPGSITPEDPHAPLPLEERIGVGAAVIALTSYQCAWPIGDPGDKDFHYCSKRRDHNISPPYCPDHQDVAASKAPTKLARIRY